MQWSRDGVRSWLVCLAALYALASTWGTSASSARAIIQPRLEDLFKYSNESDASTENALVHTKTAAVYSLHNGIAHLMALPAAFLVHHVGCRLTLLVGFALTSAGSAVAALWPHSSLWVWWLGFGAATGTGTLSSTSPRWWSSSRRSIATPGPPRRSCASALPSHSCSCRTSGARYWASELRAKRTS